MRKENFNSIIEKLKSIFSDDEEALESIDLLEKKSEDLSWDSLGSKVDEFAVPKEIDGKKNAYAIFTDGACRGNPGPGSWAMIAQDSEGEILFQSSGIEVSTTNNKMEMTAAIRGMQELLNYFEEINFEDQSEVFLFSDSKYVVEGLKNWVPGWKKKGWKKADKKVPENVDLWKELDFLESSFDKITFIWVRGHSGHPQNEYCDTLANDALDDSGF